MSFVTKGLVWYPAVASSNVQTVRKSGYLDWNKSRVIVTRDECHVNQVHLVARMVRSP
jgi:hypothetical protein